MLDKMLTGLNKGNLILIGARPAMGKTSFALNLAQNITMGARKKCVVFSLEMQKTELAERLLSSQAGVESQKLKTGELTDDEWVRLGNAAATYNDVELYLDDTSAITVPEIKSRVRRMRNVDCIIIDYLGLISSATKKENRVQEVSEITRSLKMMAKDLNIPVICCAQLSRGTEGHGKIISRSLPTFVNRVLLNRMPILFFSFTEKHITARKLMKISKTKLMLIKQSLLLLKTVTVQPAQLN